MEAIIYFILFVLGGITMRVLDWLFYIKPQQLDLIELAKDNIACVNEIDILEKQIKLLRSRGMYKVKKSVGRPRKEK